MGDLHVWGRLILDWMLKKYEEYIGRKLIQGKVQCWYFVKNVMILQVSLLYELWEITIKQGTINISRGIPLLVVNCILNSV